MANPRTISLAKLHAVAVPHVEVLGLTDISLDSLDENEQIDVFLGIHVQTSLILSAILSYPQAVPRKPFLHLRPAQMLSLVQLMPLLQCTSPMTLQIEPNLPRCFAVLF